MSEKKGQPVYLRKSRLPGEAVTYKEVLHDTWTDFLDNTGLPGISNMNRARYKIFSLIWLAIFVFGCYQTTVDVITIVNNYQSYPYSTKIDVDHVPYVDFPAVTICNQNRIHCKKLQEMMILELSSDDSTISESLQNLYLSAQCGVSLGCFDTIKAYAEYILGSPGQIRQLPADLIKSDLCISCNDMLDYYTKQCREQSGPDMPPSDEVNTDIETTTILQFFWEAAGCFQKMKDKRRPPDEVQVAEFLSCPLKEDSQLEEGVGDLGGGFSVSKLVQGPRQKRASPRTISRRMKPNGKRNKMNVSDGYNVKMSFLATYMDLPNSIKVNLSYSFSEMVKDCVFLGMDCSDGSFFISSFHTTVGNCYTFNNYGIYNTTYTGSSNSLSMVLDIMQGTYLPKLLTEKAGARVVIHRPGTPPMLDDEGADVPPGMSSSFAIKQKVVKSLEYPYEANCVRFWNDTLYEVPEEYTIHQCLRMCMQRLVVNRCKCIHPLYPEDFYFNGTYYDSSTSPYCNLTSGAGSNNNCVGRIFAKYSLDPTEANCGCRVACYAIEYPQKFSLSSWPPSTSEDTIRHAYMSKGDVDENILKVDVYFNTLSSEELRQDKVYATPWDLVSELGGALSLYMGISLFLIMEVMELMIHWICNTALYCTNRYQRSPPNPASRTKIGQMTGLMYPILTPEVLGQLKQKGHIMMVPHGMEPPKNFPGDEPKKVADAESLNTAFDKAFAE